MKYLRWLLDLLRSRAATARLLAKYREHADNAHGYIRALRELVRARDEQLAALENAAACNETIIATYRQLVAELEAEVARLREERDDADWWRGE
jgi:peptidoglycan hydrolase CwlO-like protein